MGKGVQLRLEDWNSSEDRFSADPCANLGFWLVRALRYNPQTATHTHTHTKKKKTETSRARKRHAQQHKKGLRV